jgi:hypothetical protein
MTKRAIRIIDNNAAALKTIGALLLIFAGFCITVLVDMFAWPVTIIAVSSAMTGVWFMERGWDLPKRKLADMLKVMEMEKDMEMGLYAGRPSVGARSEGALYYAKDTHTAYQIIAQRWVQVNIHVNGGS